MISSYAVFCINPSTWWHHQMATFSMLLALCEGNPLVTGGFPSKRPVTQSFEVFFDVHLDKQQSKQWSCQWFEMLWCPYDVTVTICSKHQYIDGLVQRWRRHQMETFSTLLAICVGNSPVTGEFPAQKPVTRSFDVFFDLCLNKRLSKQLWCWWFETPSRPIWHHAYALELHLFCTMCPIFNLAKS